MAHHPGDSYFATQVLSAPRHKLHLMLLEGALRHGRRAEALLVAGQEAAATDALIRSQEVMAELLASLKPDLAPALVRRVAGIYVFVHPRWPWRRRGATWRSSARRWECWSWNAKRGGRCATRWMARPPPRRRPGNRACPDRPF